MSAPRTYLVAYDVADDRRRERLAKLLGAYGDRIQYSVFLIEVKPARVVRLSEMMAQVIQRDEDSILVCDLGNDAADRMVFHGRSRPVTPKVIVF